MLRDAGRFDMERLDFEGIARAFNGDVEATPPHDSWPVRRQRQLVLAMEGCVLSVGYSAVRGDASKGAGALSSLTRWMVSWHRWGNRSLDAKEGVLEKRYRVTLMEQERQDLTKLVSTGKAAAKKLVRARILL